MIRVVLFKNPSEKYKDTFNNQNYELLFIEPLQSAYLDSQKLETKLLEDDYSGMIFTSPKAIEAVAKCWTPSTLALWKNKKIYTIGDASAQKIKKLLGLKALGTATGCAQNLVALISNENCVNTKFLYPCSTQNSGYLQVGLTSKGITVDAITVVETKEREDLRMFLKELDTLSPHCLVFFSCHGVEYVHRQLQTFTNKLSKVPHFALGDSTANQMMNLGVEVAGVATEPTPESISELIKQYFKNSGL